MIRAACIGVLLATTWFVAADALAGDEEERDRDAVLEVRERVETGDCRGALRRLDAGLRAGGRGMLVMAASMYQEGICVRRDWVRAERLYLRAVAAGHRGAAFRLASGYASRGAGPDHAAALWWAHRTPTPLPADCRVEAYADTMAPESFVATLQAWPRGKVAACSYVAGIGSFIVAETYYPTRARRHGVEGEVVVRFVPSRAEFTANFIGAPKDVEARWVADGKSARLDHPLLEHVRAASEAIVARDERPEGIDPTWIVAFVWTFKLI